MIRFTCPNCETNLKTADEKAGTKILCPECKDRVTVPSASGDKKTAAKAANRPRSDAPKSNKGLIIGVAAAACVLVAGGGILVAMQIMGDSKPKDTKSDRSPAVADNTQDTTTPPPVTPAGPASPVLTAPTNSGTPPVTPPAKPPTTAPAPPAKAPDTKLVQASPTPASSGSTEGDPLNDEKIIQRLLHSTAWIVTELSDGRISSGSGGLIDKKNRLVLTNEHVISDAEKNKGKATLSVFFPEYDNQGQLISEQKPYLDKLRRHEGIACFVVAKEARRDLALVQLTSLPSNVQELRIASKSPVRNQKVNSLGNPSAGTIGALWIPTPGQVRQVYNFEWMAGSADPREGLTSHRSKVVLTNSAINPGDSGGPLVNERGELVAVVHGSNTRLVGMSLFIDVTEVRSFINSYYKKEKLPPLPEGAATEERNENVRDLAKHLKDPDPERRIRAATRLAQIGVDARAAVPDLLEVLKNRENNNDEIRTAVADALEAIGGVNQAQLGVLTEALKDKVPAVRKSILGVLKGMGAEADTVVKEIAAALKDLDKGVRLAALQALGQMGAVARSAIPDLIATMKEDTSPEVKAEAATALSRMGRAALPALEALGEAAKNDYQDLRVNALRAIQQIGPEAKTLVPTLEKVLVDQRDEMTRLEAVRTLGEIGTDAKAAVPSMLTLLTNKSYHVPVAEALAKIGRPAVASLAGSRGLEHPKWEVRLGAAIALKQLGSDAKAALRNLNAHVTLDPNAEVRKACLDAVKKIQAS